MAMTLKQKFKIKPWTHQYEAIKTAADLPHFALFFEQGTGKTLTCVNMLRTKFYKHKQLLSTLIVCPQIVMENWRREILANSNLKKSDIVLVQGKGVKRIELVDSLSGTPKVLITNYETLNMDGCFEALCDYGPKILVFDESHRCKNLKAKRTKRAIALADRAVYRFLLTGTPILNSLLDVFAQFRILDGGRLFGQNFFSFRARYFVDKNAGMPKDKYFPDWRPLDSGPQDIVEKMKTCSVAIRKHECLDLPPLVKTPIYFEMEPKLRAHYEEMKDAFITYVEDEACVANLAITKALRLQQMVSGFIKTGSEKAPKYTHFKSREKALKDLIEDMVADHKIVVWAVFKENYKAIRRVCDDLKVKYVEVHGEISQGDKVKAIDEFDTSDDIRVFIGHPGSGGIGVNLTVSDISVFYSRSFSLEYDLQAEARNHRGGSEIFERITRYDLICQDSIDEHVLKALQGKEKISLKVLKGIAKELKDEDS